MPEPLVLLHGFSGTRRAWDGVAGQLDAERYLPIALDLPGHGDEAGAPAPITFAGCVQSVLARSPERFTLAGYSMGGRVALHVALGAPERLRGLALIACNPGIEDADERRQRLRADERLADDLERIPYEQFIERWRTQPLFADDPAGVGRLARADQRRNDPRALAGVMRGLSTGAMAPMWERLGELSMPALVVAGARDAKFLAIARRMAALIPAASLRVVAAGHGVPLECPAELARALEEEL